MKKIENIKKLHSFAALINKKISCYIICRNFFYNVFFMIQQLQELGFKPQEAKVYLTLLELGSTYVSLIASKSGINRVNCYAILDKLVARGLVSSYKHNGIKYYCIDSPKLIVNKQQEALNKAEQLLPQLLSITNTLVHKPKIQYYEGIEGVKNIFQDTLTCTDEILGYTNLEQVAEMLPTDYLKSYVNQKIQKRIKSRMLSPTSDKALEFIDIYYPDDYPKELVEVLFVNQKQFFFEYEINIFENKVSIVSLNPNEVVGFIIESQVYARTQKAIFNLAWLGATNFVAQ